MPRTDPHAYRVWSTELQFGLITCLFNFAPMKNLGKWSAGLQLGLIT